MGDLKTQRSRLISGSAQLLSGSAVTTGLNLLYNVAVARYLGPDGFGQATAVFTLLTLVSAVTLSYQLAAAKLTAQQQGAEAGGRDPRSIGRSAWTSGLVIAGALLVCAHQVARYLHLGSLTLIVLLAVGVAFYVPLGGRRGMVQGEHRFAALAGNLVLEGAVRLFGSLLLVWLGFGVRGVIAANAAAVALAYFVLRPAARAHSQAALQLAGIHREVMQAVVFFAGQMLINNSDIILVKHFFAATPAGIYAVVAMVGRVVFALCQAVVNSMVPVVAGSRAEDRKNPVLISTALGLVLALGVVLSAALRLLPSAVWTSLFGAGFRMPGPHGIPFLLALYAITSVVYSLSAVLITFVMAYRVARARWLQLGCSFAIVAGIYLFHDSLAQVILVQLSLVSALLVLVAVPLFREMTREQPVQEMPLPLTLVRQVSEDEAIAEFLKSDFAKVDFRRYHDTLEALVYTPDLTNAGDNARRRALFDLKHAALWTELPADTVWYEMQLRETDLARIRVFPRAQWRKIARGDYALSRVAGRTEGMIQSGGQSEFLGKIVSLRDAMQGTGPRFATVLMIGISDREPLAILDGNHRLVAAVLEGRTSQLRFFCGLSPQMTRCCWYRTSPRTLAAYGRNLLRNLPHRRRSRLYSLLETQVMHN